MDFNELTALRRKIERLGQQHVASLKGCSTPDGGFRHQLRSKKETMSKASTATCINSLVDADRLADFLAPDNAAEQVWTYAEKMADMMLKPENWHSADLKPGNPFTVAHLLDSALRLLQLCPSDTAAKYTGAVDVAMNVLVKCLDDGFHEQEMEDDDERDAARMRAVSGSISIQGYPPNGYLTSLAVNALHMVKKHQAQCNITGSRAIDGALVKAKGWSLNEMRRQLAHHSHPDLRRDYFQMVYCALIWEKTTQPDDRDPNDLKLARHAIKTFFEVQSNGSWPLSDPLFHYPRVGNAYCYDSELLAQLLQAETFQDIFLDSLSHLGHCVDRLDRQVHRLAEKKTTYWSSGHHPQLEGPESWTTAAVFHFLFRVDRIVAEAMRRSAFAFLGLPYQNPLSLDQDKWRKFLDCAIPNEPDNYDLEKPSLKTFVDRDFAAPLIKYKNRVESGLSFPKTDESKNPLSITAIFHGPPGTSKTELAKMIAGKLGWRLLEINPSHFVREGQDLIPAQVDCIFDMLAEVEGVVIFVDEFDEMVQEREDSAESFSRLLTTLMLPKLTTISDRRRTVFLLATNHVEKFDVAVRRPGRFDVILPVLPPNVADKLDWMKADLKALVFSAFNKIVDSKTSLECGHEASNGCSARAALRDLTYLETAELIRKAKPLQEANESKITELLQNAHRSCIMMSPIKGNSELWKARIKQQLVKTRTPV